MQNSDSANVETITSLVYDFFIESNDFNGIPLRDISGKLGITYIKSINLIRDMLNAWSTKLQVNLLLKKRRDVG